MAMFVHLTSEPTISRMRRDGISRSRRAGVEVPRGVFAVPVTRDFFISHQWLRELKRRNGAMVSGIYFRILDEEMVWMGHYSQAHRRMSAAEAIAQFMVAENSEGWEVIIPRRIAANLL